MTAFLDSSTGTAKSKRNRYANRKDALSTSMSRAHFVWRIANRDGSNHDNRVLNDRVVGDGSELAETLTPVPLTTSSTAGGGNLLGTRTEIAVLTKTPRSVRQFRRLRYSSYPFSLYGCSTLI